MSNELIIKKKYYEAWEISKKYSKILIDHENNNESFLIVNNTYHQYISELKVKNIPHKNKNYIYVWETMLNTIEKNMDIDVCRASIKILYQTSIQRSYS